METKNEASKMFAETHQLLGDSSESSPLIICFHGSGDSCESWDPLAKTLSTCYRVLLYNRGANTKPKVAVTEMFRYLNEAGLSPPYVLVAHSYGGNISREFLQRRPQDVVGMVLAETGQETALDPKLEKKQYRQQILGKKPLSVIRCNSLIAKWSQLENKLQTNTEDSQKVELLGQKQLLETWDKEDEKMKKQQLKLSKNSRYIHIPDCGHHVIRDRPNAVADEVRWVMEHWDTVGHQGGVWERFSSILPWHK